MQTGTQSTRTNLLLTISLPSLFLYDMYCDPLWTTAIYPSLSIFFLAAILADFQWKTIAWRCGAALFAIAVLLCLSTPSYLFILTHYTARWHFRTEIIGEIQNGQYAFLPFHAVRSALFFCLLLSGTIFALLLERGRMRLFAAACLIHIAGMIGLTLVYLFTDINWTYPLPAYLENIVLPIYLLIATAGWFRGVGWLRQRTPSIGESVVRFWCCPRLPCPSCPPWDS